MYTYEYNSVSDILLTRLNLTIEDVTSYLNNKIIETPHSYEKSPSITVSGRINGGVITFPKAYEYLESHDTVGSSICVYYSKTDGKPVSINITQYNDGIYLLSINETIIPNDTWTCIIMPNKMIENLYSFNNRHLSVGFKIRPSNYVDTSNDPFMELYLESDKYNAVTYSLQNKCKEFCYYKLEDIKLNLAKALGIDEGRGNRKKRHPNMNECCCIRIVTPKIPVKKPTVTIKRPVIPYTEVCSLRHQYIKFKDIGCNWILAPKGIMFNYCAGTCTISSFDKSSIVYAKMLLDSEYKSNLNVCCKPIRRQSVKITYMHGKNIKQSEIKDFMPSECGC
ncbi:TGF-beta-like protein [Finch poxvirus]|uniref:TGF-beta-like protein n=2 Tax=unclassified Avipoxvirus TaxID=336487 RepID=A0AAT9UPP7_9POXV|nr:TGF-beta-like protein [Finch poxvirus]UOX39192.1 TGF-beta-like protein [Finch poxvirus]